jgi:hypothetical protein
MSVTSGKGRPLKSSFRSGRDFVGVSRGVYYLGSQSSSSFNILYLCLSHPSVLYQPHIVQNWREFHHHVQRLCISRLKDVAFECFSTCCNAPPHYSYNRDLGLFNTLILFVSILSPSLQICSFVVNSPPPPTTVRSSQDAVHRSSPHSQQMHHKTLTIFQCYYPFQNARNEGQVVNAASSPSSTNLY